MTLADATGAPDRGPRVRGWLVTAAVVATCLPACLFAPPRPEDRTGDGGLPGCTIPTDARLSASVVMATAAGDTLVRAGTWNGQRVVNVYPPGPAFDPRCPASTIPIGDDLLTVLAITPMGTTAALVMGQLPDLRWKVVAVPLDPEATMRDSVTTAEALPGDAAPPFVAYHPAAIETPEVLFGFGRALWVASGVFGTAPALKLDIQNSPEDYYAAAPLVPPVAGATWAVVGRRANLYMFVQQGSTPPVLRVQQQQPHTGTPCDPEPTACEERIARVPHVAPRGTGDLVAYSIARSATGDLALLQDDGSSTMVGVTSLSVAMVSPDDTSLQPLVLASLASDANHTLVLSTAASAPPIPVGNPGPGARVLVGNLGGAGQHLALVLAETPGGSTAADSCWVVNGEGLPPCE